jgi:hypothetical protein
VGAAGPTAAAGASAVRDKPSGIGRQEGSLTPVMNPKENSDGVTSPQRLPSAILAELPQVGQH